MGKTEVTLDQEISMNSQEFHLLVLLTQQAGAGPWQQRRMIKSLSREGCRQDPSGHQCRTRIRKRNH